MKKAQLVSLALVLAAMFLGVIFVLYKAKITTNISRQPVFVSDYKNGTYLIDDRRVTLKDGAAESGISSSKTITRYFGNEAFGDLNGDGKSDVAFLLTQETGGTGVFYYVVAALSGDQGYHGLNSIFLGDRIAPQTTEIRGGGIIVNYADRKKDEPMTTQPSVGMSKYIQVKDNNLVEIKDFFGLTNKTWKWVKTQMNDDTVITPKKADVFTVKFNEDGKINGTTDCNGFFGGYEINENKLQFGEFGMTRMFCEGSQENIFVEALGEVDSYFINQEKNLILELKMDSGSMIFE